MFDGLATAYMDTQNWIQYSTSHAAYTATTALLPSPPKIASEAISEHLISKKFLGEHAPRPRYFLHAYTAHTHVPPLCKNPGYGPACYWLWKFKVPHKTRGECYKMYNKTGSKQIKFTLLKECLVWKLQLSQGIDRPLLRAASHTTFHPCNFLCNLIDYLHMHSSRNDSENWTGQNRTSQTACYDHD